uniref:glutaminase n=1 Tax=Eptatretus burgeri TaxID=7764 RepID=A0A8C4NCX5_EPTBU
MLLMPCVFKNIYFLNVSTISMQKCHHSISRETSSLDMRLEDLLFDTIAEGQNTIPVVKFINALKATGLSTSDPRLKDSMDTLRKVVQTSPDGISLDKELFHKCVAGSIVLLTQAFRRKFVIPDFQNFTAQIDSIHENAKGLTWGKVADYIPQLAKFSPDLWGVSICTVDGQRYSVGDTKMPFCLQSYVLGTQHVHRFVGKEPSGLRFNTLSLNEEKIPHNPMVNAGAIVITSLIKVRYKQYPFGRFQSERDTGDRNFAIGYYLKEKKCFPEGTDLGTCLDFYFQLCSIEVTCESASVLAATLANGGICPITGEHVLSPEAVRNTLSLMHSCGMYDFSGQFAFHVGLPAKSGVCGAILLVVPNVMGIVCWSPSLDKLGNSVRGIHFCQAKTVINLLFAAYSGDVSAMRRFALSAMDMEQKDYDYRTALHVAAAEGHAEVVRFLLESCKVNISPKDRWGNTPMDEAVRFGQQEVVQLLQEHDGKFLPAGNDGKNTTTSQENLEGMV